MYDFVGKVRKIRSAVRNQRELVVEECCDETGNGGWVVFQVDCNLLEGAAVNEQDWVKLRFSLNGREWKKDPRSPGTLILNAVCRQIKVLAHGVCGKVPAKTPASEGADCVDNSDDQF